MLISINFEKCIIFHNTRNKEERKKKSKKKIMNHMWIIDAKY